MTRNMEHHFAHRGLTESQRGQEWEVEAGLAERGKAQHEECSLRFQGYGPDYDKWVPQK